MKDKPSAMLERQIITGLVVSTEYIQQLYPVWDKTLMAVNEAQILAQWCIEYFEEYKKAPGQEIQNIYYEKLRTGEVSKNLGEDIEDSLADLSDEYDEHFNYQYVLDNTYQYFTERHLELHQKRVQELLDSGETEQANALAQGYIPFLARNTRDLDLSDPNALLKVENAFSALSKPLFTYPGPLGEFWNAQMTRGSFIALMAIEKRGKSYWLLDMANRAAKQKCKVAFFQAGDMTEAQQLKRECSFLARKPLLQKYTGDILVPVLDCVRNQLNTCDKEEREYDDGCFHNTSFTEKSLRKEITASVLQEAFEEEAKYYHPCRNCPLLNDYQLGTVWYEKVNIKSILGVKEAQRVIQKFFIDKKRKFKISTHANSTLSVDMIKGILNQWEMEDGFIPDVIVIDYADILIATKTKEFRHQQNEIWKDLRSLSQEKDCLVITATQADAKAYEQHTLKLSNFSEDKRKYAHVTGLYGLNQDKDGREKKLGIMRINTLVKREDFFEVTKCVNVLQALNIGRPFLRSYW